MTHPSQKADDWERLARQVDARMRELQLGAHDIQARGGPSIAAVSHLRNATQTAYRSGTLTRLESALDWEPGSVQRVLRGGEPVAVVKTRPVATAVVERTPGTFSRLQLADGTEVLAWTPGGGTLSTSQEAEVRAFFEDRRAG